MDTDGVLAALVSALAGAYFLGTFGFVAYVLTRYNHLKDELRRLENRLEAQADWQKLVRMEAESQVDAHDPPGGWPGA